MATSPTVLTLAPGEQPETELEVRRSRFLARAARTDTEQDARAFIASVRAAYPDARHHCSALVVPGPGGLGAPTTERSSDDGEPAGTAGQPMLEVLRASTLVGATVVVTRYFGGVLLGTGGLVRAYSQATSQVLAAARRVRLATRFFCVSPWPRPGAWSPSCAACAPGRRSPARPVWRRPSGAPPTPS